MKTWKIALWSVVLGFLVGAAAGAAQVLLAPWPDGPWGLGAAKAVPKSGEPQPRVHVDEDRYDFGAMDAEARGRHAFRFHNLGEAPLTLEAGPTTCKCTASIIGRDVLAPGEWTDVVVEWTGKNYSGSFTQTATIITNDPQRSRVTLTITGRVVRAVRVEPQSVVFSRITSGEPASATFRVLGFRNKPLQLLDWQFQRKETADLFEVSFQPLSEEELKKYEDVTCGFLGRLTVKPGLPLGAFRQELVINTDSSVAPQITVPIRGVVGSEVSVVGPGWMEDLGVLRLGTVSSQMGLERTVLIRVGGPLRDRVKLKVLKVQPDLLQVQLGQPRQLSDTDATITPLTIRIPPGSPPADHWGSTRGPLGEILLETNHPKAPQLKILVSFAISG